VKTKIVQRKAKHCFKQRLSKVFGDMACTYSVGAMVSIGCDCPAVVVKKTFAVPTVQLAATPSAK
jgi:hypothetical protein